MISLTKLQTFNMYGRVLTLFLPLASLVCLVAALVHYTKLDSVHHEYATRQQQKVRVGMGSLINSLTLAQQDVRYLAAQYGYWSNHESSAAARLARLAVEWRMFSDAKPLYDQIRWIDEAGMERLRIDRRGQNPLVVPGSELQYKGDRYYFTKTNEKKRGDLFISPLDLNIEHGRIEIPYKPMIRVGMPVFGRSGKRQGVVILNVAAESLLHHFVVRTSFRGEHAWLVNKQGYWLAGPTPADEWGFMFKRPNRSMAHRYPRAWRRIAGAASGQFETPAGIWTFSTLLPWRNDDPFHYDRIGNIYKNLSAQDKQRTQWKVISFLPKAEYNAGLGRFDLELGGIALALLIVFLYGSIRLALTQKHEVTAHQQSKNLFEFAPDATVMVNGKGVIVQVNRRAEQLFGWRREELVGQSVDLLAPLDTRAGHAVLRERYMESAEPRPMAGSRRDLRAVRKDGTLLHVDISLSPMESTEGPLVAAAIRDISEHLRSEQAMREALTMLDTIEDGAYIFDPHTLQFRYVNQGAIRQLGYPKEQLLTMTYDDINPLMDISQCHALIAPLLSNEVHSIQVDTLHKHKDGHEFPVEITIQSVVNPEGDTRCIAMVRDVTERRRAMRELESTAEQLRKANQAIDYERTQLARRVEERTSELRTANRQLAQADRAKSAFLAAMSHEIRTPMNGVVGMIEVLLHSQLDPHQIDTAKTIRDSAFSLLTLIDDILDFSKIEAGRLDLERTEVSVQDIIESISSSLEPVAAAKGVDVFVFIDPRIPPWIWNDQTRLRQVLYNLVGNAIKFSGDRPRKRGRVGVRAALVDSAPMSLIFTVTDNGIGMKPETLAKLFTSFTQAEVSTTRRFGGTGLGLAITKRLVDLMGGEIKAESTENAGATFTVTLPIEIAESGPKRVLPDLSGVDCIVVESLDVNADDLRIYLEHAGAHVEIASDRDEVARQARNRHPPVVIQDIGRQKVAQVVERIHTVVATVPKARFLLITRGKRRRARVELPDVVTIDREGLRQDRLLRAVAVAAGRQSPEVFHGDVDDDLPHSTAPLPTVAEARTQGQLILVVEDDDVNQKVILRQLGLLGYAAEVASNGVDALAMWLSGNYALVLTDLHMPEMDGYDLARAIRRHEDAKTHVPIIALTANALRGEARRSATAGMDAYLTKPIQLRVLREALGEWMPDNALTVRVEHEPDVKKQREDLVVNVDVLGELVGNDRHLMRELLSEYLKSMRSHVKEMREAIEAGDPKHVGSIAHKLKSSSRSVGATAFGDLCAELENAGRIEDKHGVVAHMEAFDIAVVATERDIEALLEKEEI